MGKPRAFPFNYFQQVDGQEIEVTEPGMTLRDYFASQALVGCLSNSHTHERIADQAKKNGISAKAAMAILCYDFADEMLKAREL